MRSVKYRRDYNDALTAQEHHSNICCSITALVVGKFAGPVFELQARERILLLLLVLVSFSLGSLSALRKQNKIEINTLVK